MKIQFLENRRFKTFEQLWKTFWNGLDLNLPLGECEILRKEHSGLSFLRSHGHSNDYLQWEHDQNYKLVLTYMNDTL